jgi:hypothetical protein
MIKDYRYNVVRILFEQGEIKTFAQIFDYIPKTVVGSELRTNNNRITLLIKDPLKFKLSELIKIANVIGIEPDLLVNMALNGPQNKKKKPGKKTSR